MADPKYDQGVRRDKDIIPYVMEVLPEDEFGDLQFDGDLIYGHGADGDVTITGDTSLSEDMYYNNLTINSGATLNPNGFRVFVKNTLTLNGDLGIKETVASVTTGTLEGTVGVGANIVDGLGGAGEPDGYVPGYTFTGSGSKTTSVGVASKDFYDLRDAINAYKQRGETFFRAKGGAGGGTGADGADVAGTNGSYPPNATSVGAAGGKGATGTGGSGGTGGRGGGVVMVSARTITGSGGLYCEGGAGNDGTAGTTGDTAPDYFQPATGGYQPPTFNSHAITVFGITGYTTAQTGHTFVGNGDGHAAYSGPPCTAGDHIPAYYLNSTWHLPAFFVCNAHTDYPASPETFTENPTYGDVAVYGTHGGTGYAHTPGQDFYVAAVTYPGGAGGTGATGQRGGRGGGGALIVVTRKAGTPSYTYNTGVNGALIALDSANV